MRTQQQTGPDLREEERAVSGVTDGVQQRENLRKDLRLKLLQTCENRSREGEEREVRGEAAGRQE